MSQTSCRAVDPTGFCNDGPSLPSAVTKEGFLSFQVPSIARRSMQAIRIVLGKSLEAEKSQVRKMQVCIAEVYNVANPADRVVCLCTSLLELPATGNAAVVSVKSGREVYVLPSTASPDGLLCSAAATGAGLDKVAPLGTTSVTSPSALTTSGVPTPVSTATVAPAPATTAAVVTTASATSAFLATTAAPVVAAAINQVEVQNVPEAGVVKATAEGGSIAPAVVVAMILTALVMCVCFMTQGFVKHRTSQVASRAPSASDLERIPALQVPPEVDEDGDPLDPFDRGRRT
eukprot:TRINITY_DN29604_c0_g1_i1.p1 TRINITY_DN29604_c0_g1~~TRINITY_DN29604_c0_g1_i1.p1  ORF type:complete len:328 (-),score=51.34 TRINITY_DN29604_c0_g1_i1:100-966(-)